MRTSHRSFGITARITAIALYGAAAFLVAGRFGEKTPQPAPTSPLQTEPAQSETTHLKIELLASRPATAWEIRLEGNTLVPLAVSGLSWSGEFAGALPADSRLVLSIEPTPTDSDAPFAVRLRIQGETAQIDRTYWSNADLVEAIALDSFRRSKEGNP